MQANFTQDFFVKENSPRKKKGSYGPGRGLSKSGPVTSRPSASAPTSEPTLCKYLTEFLNAAAKKKKLSEDVNKIKLVVLRVINIVATLILLFMLIPCLPKQLREQPSNKNVASV